MVDMKYAIVAVVAFLSVGCAVGLGREAVRSGPYDVKADIELYLSAENPETESKVLRQLRDNAVSHEEVKKILRERPLPVGGVRGSHDDLDLDLYGKKYSYSIFTPPDSGKALPLIVILHGLGSTGDAIIGKWVERLQGEFIVVCPTYPIGAWWTKTAEDFVLQLMRKIQAEYPVDRNRIFISGLSNGAIGAFMIGMYFPDYFAGIVPIAGGVTERLMPFLINLNNTPVYIIHGEKDPVFPVSYLRRTHKILADMKYPVIYREHQEAGSAHGGHFLPEGEVGPLVDWLLRQRRETHPKIVRMSREDNHLNSANWARIVRGKGLAALQIPGPEVESLNIHDGKLATLFVTNRGNNRIEIMGNNFAECEVYLSSDSVDLDSPLHITTQEIVETEKEIVLGEMQLSFNGKATRDTPFMLKNFKARGDPDLLFDAVIKISPDAKTEIAWNR